MAQTIAEGRRGSAVVQLQSYATFSERGCQASGAAWMLAVALPGSHGPNGQGVTLQLRRTRICSLLQTPCLIGHVI